MELSNNILGGSDTARGDSPQQDRFVGKELDQRYLIERKLGQGGFGSVYLATDRKMSSRQVVVKVMHADETFNEWSLKKFKQEIEALTRVNHPSIVGIFDNGETPEGIPYIVMQFVKGVSLRSEITPEGMPFLRAANIFTQIGRAVGAAHNAGILHRDLKPENIMLETFETDDEHVKIIDFGVAKIKDSNIPLSTAKDRAVGTIAYMSPEQLLAQPLTTASDVYALGVIAYEVVTGRRPLNPDSAFQLLELQRAGTKVRPADLRPSLPKATEIAILKALAFDASDRYASAREFCDILSTTLRGETEPTERKPVSETTVPDPEVTEKIDLETAHVLFMDFVGYSKLLIDDQRAQLRELQELVRTTDECQRRDAKDLICLPTGDGMALVFFGDPEAACRCAIEISRATRKRAHLQLRMGVHSGLVYRMADINTNRNVAGGGINISQRVMDCGDNGHILVSKRVADDLGQLARWADYLHDLGTSEVKHGLKLHLFNLHGDDFGNPEVPAKLAPAKKSHAGKLLLITSLLLLACLGIAVVWYTRSRNQPTTEAASSSGSVPLGPTRSWEYWVTVQNMVDGKPHGKPFDSAGDVSYVTGWEFQFNFQPNEAGALYLLSEGPGKNGTTEYNVLFPLPQRDELDPRVAVRQQLSSGPYRFGSHAGLETLWIIWATNTIDELDKIFVQAVNDRAQPGVISDPAHINQLKSFVETYRTQPPQVTVDKTRKRTTVRAQGDIAVGRIELSHDN